MKEIKLMADYHCYPLWGTTPDDFGDISPDELPISLGLKIALRLGQNDMMPYLIQMIRHCLVLKVWKRKSYLLMTVIN